MNYADLNKRITDRHDVFYWQAERKVTEEESSAVWKDRHSVIKNEDLIKKVNACLKGDECTSIDVFDPDANFGNVNSCRVGHLKSGKDVIIRCHPKGVKNGYFYVESLVAQKLIENKLPSYKTYYVHQCQDDNDYAFQIIDKIKGQNVQNFLKAHPEKEDEFVEKIGKMMAKVHNAKIEIEGYGSFDNELAKEGKLKGIYDNFYDSIVAGLEYDFKTLIKNGILNEKRVVAFRKLFSKDNPIIKCDKVVLVHNDFADWNLMTDGKTITGIIDLDECCAGDPIRDIACWSTFFDIKRVDKFLEGYFSIAKKPDNFEPRFQLLRLRYNISKMCLRTRRYAYNPKEEFRLKIERGKVDLKNDAQYFGIDY